MSFLLSIFSFFTIFTTQVEWSNVELDVPLFENIEDYKYIPEARLYVNGVLRNDPDMFYERDNVDHIFFSVITTSNVRTYNVRFRVHFPSFDVVHTQDIVYHIVDISPPEIVHLPIIRIKLGDSMPDLLEELVIRDNYDEIENLNVTVNNNQVILNQTGIYAIEYYVSDQSGNTTYRETTFEVYDVLAPLIILKKEIVLSFGTVFNWRDFFTISDNDDPFPDVDINESRVDYSHLGTYELIVTATDKNGLVTQKTVLASIVDQEKPVIIFRSQPTPIPVFSDELDIQFLSYVLAVNDNYDDVSIDDISFTYDIEFDVLGTYNVYYKIQDQSNNLGEYTLRVSVLDNQNPEIHIPSPLIFDVYSAKPFLIDFIEYTDNYTTYNLLTIKMTESVNMNQIGMYPLVIEVTDKSSNKAILRVYVEIVDRVEPQIFQLNDILITNFSYKDVTQYFEVSDNYDDSNIIEIEIDDSRVDYESVGGYPISIYAYDISGNVGILQSEIMVIDIIDPELNLRQYSITVDVYSQPLNLISFILEAKDNYDDLSIDLVVVDEDIDYEKIGKYSVIYQLTDQSMNQTTKMFNVIVDDFTPPVVSCSSISLNLGEFFDPLLGLIASDNLEEIEIKWFPQMIDTNTPGTKVISYVVTDTRGNYTTFEREIIIEPTQETFDITQYIPVILVTCLGLAAGLYFYKQMR